VRPYRHGRRRWTQDPKRTQSIENFLPGYSEFAHRNSDELIQYLHSDHAACGKQRLGGLRTPIVFRKRIDEHVRLEERLTASHSLPDGQT